jgi:hypothetical protein
VLPRLLLDGGRGGRLVGTTCNNKQDTQYIVLERGGG